MISYETLESLKSFSTSPYSAVLKNEKENEKATEFTTLLKLASHPDKPKNWDSFAAFLSIIKHTEKEDKILDAGGEYYSVILPQLASVGYENLFCINTAFHTNRQKGHIKYEKGDITRTRFENNYFNAITCLSVIEHGVQMDEYFKEMSRILKPGGILFSSTDYWDKTIDTKGKHAFGAPIRIFNSEEITMAINIAKKYDLKLFSPINLECEEKVIEWKPYNLKYTFIYFILQKK